MTYFRPNMESIVVRQAISANGYTGTGTLARSDPRSISPSYEYSSSYKVTDAVNLPGPGAILIRSPFSGLGAPGNYVAEANLPAPTVTFQCYGDILEDQYTIRFPKNVHVQTIPRNVNAHGKDVEYKATYHLKGNTVTAVRELQDYTAGNVCTPADAASIKKFAPVVQHDLHAQILYR